MGFSVNLIKDFKNEFDNCKFQVHHAQNILENEPKEKITAAKGIVFAGTRAALLIASVAFAVFAVAAIPAAISGAAAPLIGLTAASASLYAGYKLLVQNDSTACTPENVAKDLGKRVGNTIGNIVKVFKGS